ncbi:unnamed protein product [Caenorhabditis auriculariae]|uniref:Enolase-phosphatase E1 n=1 Tax=Caenorhabditis auriculariae TaxID=2777116 RepID=A0A8S1H9M6_9PELO|nr:unnamed protein product [Caenorhabditis auriculariae]
MRLFDALILDIEGTVTSISFVKDTLFPYASDHVESWLVEHFDEPQVGHMIEDVRRYSAQSTDAIVRKVRATSKKETIEDVVNNVRHWIQKDEKVTPMKALQGLIWQEAYSRGAIKGHVYPDVLSNLTKFRNEDIRVFIYSSGSVHAQKLLFSHSVVGDLSEFIRGYFDTNIGYKGQAASYAKICQEISVETQRVLFLTDLEAEARAAAKAGLQVKIVWRDENAELSQAAREDFDVITSLEEL